MTTLADAPPKASLMFRALRGSAFIMMGYAGSQALRLAANLILTRLLFPEAFGLMALVTVFLVGLTMFSDVGIGPSISQSPRGDDPDFLDTAWTIQIVRGFLLWLAACALAWPVSAFYGEPALLWLLPLAGASLAIGGFDPTRIETAHRHLLMGRLTLLDLAAQILGIVAMIGLAVWWHSVAALVAGSLLSVTARLALTHLYLPGPRNRLRWERNAAVELIGFGKWILGSTICGFFSAQGDRAILGKFLTLSMLGVYNIGFFLASFPLQLGYAVTGRLLIPIYREKPAHASAENYAKLRKMRLALTGGILTLVVVMAHVGLPLVGLLYDARYAAAGAIVVVTACIQIPIVIGMSYDQAALAAGDSRGFFVLSALRASLQIGCLLVGAASAGLIGALAGMGIAALATHPFVVWLARRHRVWDPCHDALFGALGAVLGALALWRNWEAIAALA